MAISMATTVKYLRKGDKGDPGDTGDTGRGVLATGVRYRLNATGSAPIGITAKAVRDVVNETWRLSFRVTTVPNPWSSDAPVPTASQPYLWKYSAILYTDGTIETEGPVCIGQRGDDGTTIKDSITYYCITSTSVIYNDGIYANWDEDELEIMYDNSVQDNEWTSDVIQATEEKPYLWRFSAVGYSDLTIAQEGPVCIGHYGQKGAKGDTGIQGPFIQYRGYWDERTTYYNQKTGNGLYVIDVVWYEDTYYMCIKTNINQNPEDDYNTDSLYWVQANFHDFIAAQLILAENGVIAFSQNQQILLQDADGNITAGAKGQSTNANDIRFWAGTTGTDPDIENAPFRVYEDGAIVGTRIKLTQQTASLTTDTTINKAGVYYYDGHEISKKGTMYLNLNLDSLSNGDSIEIFVVSDEDSTNVDVSGTYIGYSTDYTFRVDSSTDPDYPNRETTPASNYATGKHLLRISIPSSRTYQLRYGVGATMNYSSPAVSYYDDITSIYLANGHIKFTKLGNSVIITDAYGENFFVEVDSIQSVKVKSLSGGSDYTFSKTSSNSLSALFCHYFGQLRLICFSTLGYG